MANSFRVRFEVDGDGKVQAQIGSIGTAAVPATKSVKALGDEVAKVGDNLDKAGAGQREYQRQLAVLDAALKKNIITQREYNELTRKAWDASPNGEKWRAVGEGIRTTFLAAGTAAAGALALIFKNSVEAEQELAQLDAVLKSTGQSATWSKEQITGMADEIARASTYSGGEVTNAATRLLSYSGIVSTNFKDALQVAIDQSARLGISVEQSAETIGRALERPSKAAAALAQQGFGAAFTPAVRKSIQALEDAGHAAEAQRMVLDILNESYEGAAKAARDTFSGSLKALMNSLNDLTTGEDGSLDGATEAVNTLTDTLSSDSTRKAFGDITGWVAGFTAELIGAIAQMSAWWSKAREMRSLAAGGNKSDASYDALNARLGETTQQRQQLQAWRSNAFGIPLTDSQQAFRQSEIKRLDEERVALQREITRRINADNFAGVVSSVSSTAKPGLTGDVADPKIDKSAAAKAEREAERIKRATETMAGAQRAWTTELASVDNAIIDAYNKRLDEIADKTTAAARAGVPTDQINAFTTSMRELALQIRDQELATFQKEFADDTADMAAQLAGPGVAALLKYQAGLAEAQKQLSAGAISQDLYAAREKALRDQMNAGAIQMLQDIAEERDALTLNSRQLEIYNRLKQAGVEANTAYGQSIVQATVELQRQREVTAVIGDVQSATHELASDAIVSFGSAGDAAERFKDRLIRIAADMLADRAIQSLFKAGLGLFGGSSAYTGGGLGAGSISGFGNNLAGFAGQALFGFGGGRAAGGNVRPGNAYEITEGGRPELLRQGNKTFLLPGANGVVVPASAAASATGAGGPGPQVNVNIIGAPSQPQVTTRSNGAGGVDVEVLFKQIEGRLANNMGTGTGALYAATKGRLNVQDRR